MRKTICELKKLTQIVALIAHFFTKFNCNFRLYLDNELCDYIMVMIANHKTRYQMKDDLSLFLGKDTDHFVDWLHDLLKNMKLSVGQFLIQFTNYLFHLTQKSLINK